MPLHSLLLGTRLFPPDEADRLSSSGDAGREKVVYPPIRVLFAGGGTGGHLFPAIAIAESFVYRNPETQILFVSTGNDFERSVLRKNGFTGRWIAAEGIKGRGILQKLKAVSKLPWGILASMRILKEFCPDLVIGVGSYSSGPVVLAAYLSRTPVVLHEQNTVPGITNRFLARFSKKFFISFAETRVPIDNARIRLTGNPVRRSLLADSLSLPKTEMPSAEKERFTVLILGGSQGAHSINMAVIEALGHLAGITDLRFIHQTGTTDEEMVRYAYMRHGCKAEVSAFFNNMGEPYRKADLVICRAGATTVAELTALGKCAVYIPYPFAADNHQAVNAEALKNAGAAEMILEAELDGVMLAKTIERFERDRQKLARMAERSKALGQPRAADAIVDECYQLFMER